MGVGWSGSRWPGDDRVDPAHDGAVGVGLQRLEHELVGVGRQVLGQDRELLEMADGDGAARSR